MTYMASYTYYYAAARSVHHKYNCVQVVYSKKKYNCVQVQQLVVDRDSTTTVETWTNCQCSPRGSSFVLINHIFIQSSSSLIRAQPVDLYHVWSRTCAVCDLGFVVFYTQSPRAKRLLKDPIMHPCMYTSGSRV